MSEQHEQASRHLENQLARAARHLPYPPTPDLTSVTAKEGVARPARRAETWRKQSLLWATLTIFIILGTLLMVPPVRAAIVQFLQIGTIRIFREPTPTPSPTATSLAIDPIASQTPSPRPSPSPTPLVDLLDLAGETTLAEAQTQVNFPLRVPPDFGLPDRVFVQDFSGPLVVLVWLAPDDPSRVELSLHLLGPTTFAGKSVPETIEETSVNGQPALWLRGPHFLQLEDGRYEAVRLVEGNVLLWTEAGITYRLETAGTLTEAVRLAESLREP